MGKSRGGSSKKDNIPRVEDKDLGGDEQAMVEYEEPVVRKRAPRKPKPSNEACIAAFAKCEYVPTRWGDKEALRKLGILEDVQLVLKNMGFKKVLDMAHKVYPDEVAQLLGSFELKINFTDPIQPIETLGYVRFFVNGFSYKLSIQDLCKTYGFHPTLDNKIRTDKRKDALVWDMIGRGSYSPGVSRATSIANPVLRYVHKLLSHTLFARKFVDKVKEDEMAFIINGVKPLLKEEFTKKMIVGYEDANLGIYLAQRLLSLKKRILDPREENGKIYIGGFLTPLLLACKVPLGRSSPIPLTYLDMSYLFKTSFISGKEGVKIVYNFPTSKEEDEWVYLPNQVITRVNSLENISFLQAEKHIINEAILPDPIMRIRKGKAVQEETRNQEDLLGSARYHHPPYQGRVQSEATRHALEGVNKNQRCNKWQSRAIHNLKKGFKKKIKGLEGTISDMNETISGLKAIVEKFVLRKQSPPRHEDGSSSYDLALEETRRKSISYLPSHTSTNDEEPSRASSYETRAPRRKRRHIPTPSPPSSNNDSLHLSDSNSES